MTILETETAIIEKLRESIIDLLVEGYPDIPDTYTLKHPKGAVLVNYQGSSFADPKPAGIVLQMRRVEIDTTIIVKNLRNHDGAYAYVDAVRETLTGWIEGIGRIYPTREGFISVKPGGIWQYGVSFAFNATWEEAE